VVDMGRLWEDARKREALLEISLGGVVLAGERVELSSRAILRKTSPVSSSLSVERRDGVGLVETGGLICAGGSDSKRPSRARKVRS
jgi:hypothetical protein